jgi:hypothetical protein
MNRGVFSTSHARGDHNLSGFAAYDARGRDAVKESRYDQRLAKAVIG